MMITEQMMEHVATALKLDPYKASRGALCWLANIVMEAVCVPILLCTLFCILCSLF